MAEFLVAWRNSFGVMVAWWNSFGVMVTWFFFGDDVARNPRLRHARTPVGIPDTNDVCSVLWDTTVGSC